MSDQTAGETNEEEDDIVPPDWDLFVPDLERLRLKAKKGKDVKFAAVRIYRLDEQRAWKERIAGEFAADMVTTEWMQTTCGPGFYEVHVLNAQRHYIAGQRLRITPRQEPEPPPETAPALQTGAGGIPADITNQLLTTLLHRAINPPQDPLRDAIAQITQLMAASMQHSQQVLTQMAQMQSQNNGSEFKELALQLINKPPPPPAPPSQSSSIKELMTILGMGMQLKDQLAGGDNGSKWMEMIPQVVDSIGGPLAAIMASGIKDPDQRAQALKAINAHQDDRGQPQLDGDDAPIDTSGENLI